MSYVERPGKPVFRHGKRIETVELVPLTPSVKRRKARQETFAQIPLLWAAWATKSAKIPGAMVLILLQYMAWKAKSNTFSLSNEMLAQYGVSREIKRRVLARLEASGVIRVERRGKQSPVVTLVAANGKC